MAAEVGVSMQHLSMSSAPESMSQESNSSELTDIIFNFYRNGTYTDVTFRIKCGDDWIVQKAHKIVLAMWSPVFADMFFGPNAIEQETVVITDVTPQVFTAMIKFAYGSVCDLNRLSLKKDVGFQLKMFRASQRYQIEHLEQICRDNVSLIKPDKHNVFQLLDACRLINAEGRVDDCLEFLQTNTAEILQSYDLCEVTLDMMMTLLDLKRVSFSSEYELVMWMFAWAKNEQVKPANTRSFRGILDDVLGHVDLTAMDGREFGQLLRNHEGVFSESECYRIFRNIADPGSCAPPDWAKVINREYNARIH